MNTAIDTVKVSNHYLARQAIFDIDKHVCGYELFYRSEESLTTAVFPDDATATANVIVNALGEFGLNNLVYNSKCFINVSSSFLLSKAVEVLPSGRIILEITKDVTINEAFITRCKELKKMGFELSINKFTYSVDYNDLMPLLDYIKINVSDTPASKLPVVIAQVKKRSDAILIAEGIAIESDFNACKSLELSFYQGYYFDRPYLFHICSPSSAYANLVYLMELLIANTSLDDIIMELEKNIALSLSIFRLVSSTQPQKPLDTSSLRNTVTELGKEGLSNWLQLVLLARKPAQLP